MTNPEHVWMTRGAYTRLQQELAALSARSDTDGSEDRREDDDNLVMADMAARQTRIHQIHQMLAKAIVGEDPDDDGVAEAGMVLTVRYDDSGDTETFLLGVRGVEDADIEVYSIQSPLGAAIAGARPGEQRSYSIPSGANVPVTLLKAVPYGIHIAKSADVRPTP